MATETKVQPETIIAEGRLHAIGLDVSKAQIVPFTIGDLEAPIVVTVKGDRGFYIRIYDHRQATREAYANGGNVAAAFGQCPCLVRFAVKKGTQYVVLADLGTADMVDTGRKHPLVLTKTGHYDKDFFRVKCLDDQPALHLATKICVVEPRPPKPEKPVVDQQQEVNPAMAAAMEAALSGISVR